MQEGSLVICINASNWDPYAYTCMSKLPKLHGVYRVRRIVPNMMYRNGTAGLILEGITGKITEFTRYDGIQILEEYHFRMDRFSELLPPLEIEEVEQLQMEVSMLI